MTRFFQNPFPDYEDESVTHGQAGLRRLSFSSEEHKGKLRGHVLRCALEAMKMAKTTDKDALNAGLYVGPIGLTYMYLHLFNVPTALSEEDQMKLQPLAHEALEHHLNYYAKHKASEKDLPGFLLGKAGVNAVAAVFGKLIGNEDLMKRSLAEYAAAAKICKPLSFRSDELFVGRAGFLLGALWLQKSLAVDPVPKQNLKDIWKAIIESGKAYAQKHRSPCPLMYSYYQTEYLGAAHGLCSILQMLLSFPEFCQEFPGDEKLIHRTVDYYLSLQQTSGNFPTALDEVSAGSPSELCHWCHGAPGAFFLFAKAYLHFKDEKYLAACRACGDFVWSKGLLKKGPGLCHGVAGNAYIFLLLHRLTNGSEPKHVYRAMKFAEFMDSREFKHGARTPDSPLSLYEGIAGTACYYADLLVPNRAEFPFFDVMYNYK